MSRPTAAALPPLPLLILPPLPPIADPTLARRVVTHSSMIGGPKQNLSLEGARTADYEKLEHVGDSLLCTIVVTLLHDLYPELAPGPATSLKDHLVNNKTLSQLSVRYGLMTRLIAAPEALYNARQQYRVQAAVFEAYIAGLFFDFMKSETPGAYAEANSAMAGVQGGTCSNAVTSTLSGSQYSSHQNTAQPPPQESTVSTIPSLQAAYIAAMTPIPLPKLVPIPLREHGDAITYVERWLRPLLTPVAEFALTCLRQAARDIQNSASEKACDDPQHDEVTLGSTAALNAYMQIHEGCIPQYTSRQVDGGWCGICTCTVGGTLVVTEAVRAQKKAAYTVAAWKACQQIGVPL